MSVDTTPEQHDKAAGADAEKGAKAAAANAEKGGGAPAPGLSLSFRNIRWGETLLIALAMAAGWCALFLANTFLQIFAGIVPVLAGLYLGRRIKADWLGHGLVLGFAGFLFGMILVAGYGLVAQTGAVPMPMTQAAPGATPVPLTFSRLLVEYGLLMAFSLIPFPAFGTVMAGRAEQRNQQLQQETTNRGGRLERPSVVRTVDDLRGLSLPQLGGFVRNLYTKKGFEIKDYRFIDKDKHLDLDMSYEGQPYLLRLTVADKVGTGTIQSLVQDMKKRGIARGVVIASTEFSPDAVRAGRDRKNLVLIDGPTLFDMSEN